MSWRGLSLVGLSLLAVAALMVAPALVALASHDYPQARAFGMCAVGTAAAAALLLSSSYRNGGRTETRGEFGSLIAVLLLAPVAAAAPVVLVRPSLGFEAAYFEMSSMITTTGATVFTKASELSDALNLWRALVAWLGGLIALIMAYALLAPRNLGGFEVHGDEFRGGAIGRLRGDPEWAGGRAQQAAADRLSIAMRHVAPVYAALTGALAAALMVLGLMPLEAFISAIGVLSTSGVKAVDGPAFTESGILGEAVVAVFLVLAATRHTYGDGARGAMKLKRLPADPEMRILMVVTIGASCWLFLRHWIGALQLTGDAGAAGEAVGGFFSAFWGGAFTALSFATTTGYVSSSWEMARMWSGLDNPSLVLSGLAIMGGGVATTAGGVKLLRAYALFRHGTREMERLIRPSSIRGSGASKRGLRREGAQIAWVFVMLFLLTLAGTMLALSLTGLGFEESIAASIAALSNTGPVFGQSLGVDATWLTSLNAEGRLVIVVAMVLGRVEVLALVAMMSTTGWR